MNHDPNAPIQFDFVKLVEWYIGVRRIDLSRDGGSMSNSSAPDAKRHEAAAALVELAIRGGLVQHLEREPLTFIAEKDPRGFLKLIESRSPVPPLGDQIAAAAKQKVAASGGKMDYVAAVRAVGVDCPSLITDYLAEKRGERTHS